MNKRSHTTILIIIMPLVSLFAIGLDFYIPIVPLLRTLFEVDHHTMQLTLSGFMFICALGQIIIGPICDRFGRRSIALISILIYLTGSLIPLFTLSFRSLILARILQALGASGTFLTAYASIRDLFDDLNTSTKMYSLINVCISQSPIFAPTLGGLIADRFGWRAVFVTLTLFGLYTLLSSYLFYEETIVKKHPFNYSHLKKSYLSILKHRNFQVYSLSAAVGMASFFMFFSQSPYILIDLLHYSKPEFGLLFGIVGSSFFISSLQTNRISINIGNHDTVSLGSLLMSIGGVLLILFQCMFGIQAWGFILPMIFVVCGAALTIGAGLAGTMKPFGHIAGTAFSAIGFCKFFLSASLGFLLLSLDISPHVLGTIIASLSLLSLILNIIFRKTLIEGSNAIIIPTEYD